MLFHSIPLYTITSHSIFQDVSKIFKVPQLRSKLVSASTGAQHRGSCLAGGTNVGEILWLVGKLGLQGI
jgi:hypothetical protein